MWDCTDEKASYFEEVLSVVRFLFSLPFPFSLSYSPLFVPPQKGDAIIGAHFLPRSRSFGLYSILPPLLFPSLPLSSPLSPSPQAVICHDPNLPFLSSVNLLPIETGAIVKWRLDYRDRIIDMQSSSRLFALVCFLSFSLFSFFFFFFFFFFFLFSPSL